VNSGSSFSVAASSSGQLLHPRAPLAFVVREPSRRRGGIASHTARIADEAEGDVAVLADGAVILVYLNQGRNIDALAVAHPEVERSADDDDDVRLVEGLERVRSKWCGSPGGSRPREAPLK
jgi:hypothetical protein